MKKINLIIFSIFSLNTAFAAIPQTTQSKLHEINIATSKSVDLNSGLAQLSAQEKLHRSALPHRISAPLNRVMKTNYSKKHSR
jgi:hypothetical protein